jgi:hypothetical protein
MWQQTGKTEFSDEMDDVIAGKKNPLVKEKSWLDKLADLKSGVSDSIKEAYGGNVKDRQMSKVKEAAKRAKIESALLDTIGVGKDESGIKPKLQSEYETAKAEKTPRESSLRKVMINLGVPVQGMTDEEKARVAASRIEAKNREEARQKMEQARLLGIRQVGTSLPQFSNLVGGGQFGTLGSGIAPKGY